MEEKRTSALLSEDKMDKPIDYPSYSDEEIEYLSNLRQKMVNARDTREAAHIEFDGMSYSQYWNKCESLANTEIKPKKDKTDIRFMSGTLRTKLFAFLSNIVGLNLEPDITAYNKDNIPLNNLGNAMEIVNWKSCELDNDEEKKLLRQYTLLTHGTCFVEELWEDKYCYQKKELPNYKGEYKDVKISSKLVKKDSRPTRNIVPGISVFLGDITKYFIEDQPFIFTVQTMRYDQAEKIYGKFENWKYVPKKITRFKADLTTNLPYYWTLLEEQDDYVEIIKYSDKPNQEYQIIINGIIMLPIGMPFPWGYNEYNIVQQNLKPIRANFAYGKSPIYENRNIADLLDEMTRMALLKTEKSFMPPYLNLSSRVINNSVLMPGKISMGIPPGVLQPVNPKESEGVTNSEYNMIESLMRNIDANTVSQTFTGQQEMGSNVTATQIVELQRQSRVMLGLVVTCASLLEKKCTSLRILNLLKHWFDPIDTTMDEARGVVTNQYRVISQQTNIGNEGRGLKVVSVTEEKYDSAAVKREEEALKQAIGMPVRIKLIRAEEIRQAKYIWVITVNPREKKSSELSKLMFNQMLTEGVNLGLPFNMQYVQERFAEVWEEDPSKLFSAEQPDLTQQTAGVPGVSNESGMPNPKAQANMKPTVKPVELKPGQTGSSNY